MLGRGQVGGGETLALFEAWFSGSLACAGRVRRGVRATWSSDSMFGMRALTARTDHSGLLLLLWPAQLFPPKLHPNERRPWWMTQTNRRVRDRESLKLISQSRAFSSRSYNAAQGEDTATSRGRKPAADAVTTREDRRVRAARHRRRRQLPGGRQEGLHVGHPRSLGREVLSPAMIANGRLVRRAATLPRWLPCPARSSSSGRPRPATAFVPWSRT